MASARLYCETTVKEGELTGWTSYEVETIGAGSRYPGPPDRDWANFSSQGDEATFEWRSPNDAIRETADALIAGRLTVEQALDDGWVSEWLGNPHDPLEEWLADRGSPVKEMEPEEIAEAALREWGPTMGDLDGGLNFYFEGDDCMMEHAASVLPLPAWAKVDTGESGGVGSGYLAAYVLLAPSKRLDDLERWLKEEAQRREGKELER